MKALCRFLISVSRMGVGLLFFIVFLPITAIAQTDFWQQANGPSGATVTAVAINPVNGFIFIAVSGEGVFRSTDGGTNWSSADVGLSNNNISAFAVHPNGDIFASTNNGIFRSVDNAANWMQVYVGSVKTKNVQSLVIDSQNGDVFAVTSFTKAGTVLRSTDSGTSWQEFETGLEETWGIPDVAVSPVSGVLFLASDRVGVLRSDDRGETWYSANNGITTLDIGTVAVHTNGTVFVGTDKDSTSGVSDRYIYSSSDDGQSWTQVFTSSLAAQLFAFNSAGDVFASIGGSGLIRSKDIGATWIAVNNGLRSLYVLGLAFDSNDQAFAGTHCAGVFRSNDNGANWVTANGDLKYTTILALVVKPGNGHVFAGTHCGGVFRSNDSGGTWPWVGLQGKGINALTVNAQGAIFAGTGGFTALGSMGDIYRSSDDGTTWQNVSPDNDSFNSFAVSSTGDIYAGTGFFQLCGFSFCDYGDVYHSTDGGSSWTRVASKLDDQVFALAVNATGRVFAGTREGLYRSFGDFWHKIQSESVKSLLVHPNTGDVYAGTADAIIRSSDEGENWSDVIRLPKNFIRGLSIAPDGDLFAGSEKNGVLRSQDGGDSWETLNSGLTITDVRSIGINQANGQMFAGTWGHGVFIHSGGPTAPAAPVLTSPVAGAIGQPTMLTLSWNTAAGATSYWLQVATTSDFAVPVVDVSSLTATSKEVGPLAHGSTYFWRVKATNAGGSSAWSGMWSFTSVIAAPTVPTLASPTDGSGNLPTTVSLSWNQAAGAETYRLQVASAPDFATPVFDDSSLAVTSKEVGPLAHGSVYYWRVKTKNAGGSSAWSGEWSFSTIVQLPAQVSLVTPADAAVVESDEVQFTWQQSNPEIDRYWLELATDSTMANAEIDSNLAGADTLKLVTELQDGQSYWWRVRASNVAGWGPFSRLRRFEVDIPTGIAGAGEIPLAFNLSQNYPNPFNPETMINYAIPARESGTQLVSLRIINLLGQVVRTLVNEQKAPGSYQVVWDGRNDHRRQMASGVYLYSITAGDFRAVRKMTVLK